MQDKKLRVLMGMDTYLPCVDGVVNCMHNYCMNAYDKVDLQVMVPKCGDYVDEFPYNITRCKSFFVPILKDYYGLPENDSKFNKTIMAKDYDIIHVHSPFNMAKYAIKIGKRKNIPVVATFHTNFRPIFQSILKSKGITEAVIRNIGKTYNKMDEIFVCSPTVEKQARSFGYKGKITYMPFGTEFEKEEHPEILIKQANEKLGLNEDELIFIFVGRVMPLKRIDFIIDSLKILSDKGLKFKFFVVGKGMYSDTLKAKVRELELEDKVIFTGFIDREMFPLYYARADLLLFPSLYDNFGLVKVEAAAFSTAGVFIKDSAAGYGVDDGVNGYLSDDNVEAFSKKIEEAIADRENLKTVGKNAARDLYINWAQCMDLVIKRYGEIVAERAARPVRYSVKKRRPHRTEERLKRRALKIRRIQRNLEKKELKILIEEERSRFTKQKSKGAK